MTIRIVKFETEYDAQGNGRDKVLTAPSGEDFNRTQVWHYINHINPDRVPAHKREGNSYAAIMDRWAIVGPAYEAWKRGEETPDEGTPLAAWPGVTPEQAKVLRANDVRTVEEVAKMGDTLLSRIHLPNARRLPELAKAWLDGTDAAAKDAEMAELKAQLAAMKEVLEEQVAPKRERPKKEAEAA